MAETAITLFAIDKKPKNRVSMVVRMGGLKKAKKNRGGAFFTLVPSAASSSQKPASLVPSLRRMEDSSISLFSSAVGGGRENR